MPPIPIRSIMMQKKAEAAEPTSEGPSGSTHTIAGRISNLHEHHRGKHVAVTVTHGRRTRRTAAQKKADAKNGISSTGMFDDRPRSEVYVPTEQAKHYHMGQRVNLSIAPVPDEQDDTDDMNDETDDESSDD